MPGRVQRGAGEGISTGFSKPLNTAGLKSRFLLLHLHCPSISLVCCALLDAHKLIDLNASLLPTRSSARKRKSHWFWGPIICLGPGRKSFSQYPVACMKAWSTASTGNTAAVPYATLTKKQVAKPKMSGQHLFLHARPKVSSGHWSIIRIFHKTYHKDNLRTSWILQHVKTALSWRRIFLRRTFAITRRYEVQVHALVLKINWMNIMGPTHVLLINSEINVQQNA